MAGGSAYGEEGESIQLKDLPPHEVDHMRAYPLDIAAPPFLYRVFCQQVEVFVVPADESEPLAKPGDRRAWYRQSPSRGHE